MTFVDSNSTSIIAQLTASNNNSRRQSCASPPTNHLAQVSLASASCATVMSTRALSNSHLYRDYVNLPPPPPYPGTSTSTMSNSHDHSTSNISVGSNGKTTNLNRKNMGSTGRFGAGVSLTL